MSQIALRLLLANLIVATSTLANQQISLSQVTSDNTVNTQVNQDGNVAEITGGETRGDNLFHSFQDFSVPTNNEAFFNNANDIGNIFSRVTGGNVSNIDGLIRANGSANLFLINPAGIMFGQGARLDLGGSFYGSSASSILFEDGEFSATDLDNPPLLTVNAPIGLGFRDNPGDITVRGEGNGVRFLDSEVIDTQDALRVDGDATIGLLGGNISFEDATIKTAGGRIEIGSVANGIVDLVAVDEGFTFDYSGIESFQDISLSGTSVVDASGVGGGNIQVAGKNVSLTGISGFENNTLSNQTGGDIDVFASESINISAIENESGFISGIFNRVFPDGTADAGDINIKTGSLSIGDRGAISTSLSGQGNAGDININASESVTLASQGNTSTIFSGVNQNAVGNGGDVSINSDSLSLSNGGFISANTSGQGNAGNIIVDANQTVSLDGVGTGFFTNVLTEEAIGNGGNIDLTTGSLSLSNGGSLNTVSSGQSNAGNVTINATESVFLSNGSRILVAGGGGGFINLNAKNLSITSDSQFSAGISFDSDSPDTQGGDVVIDLTEDLVINNSYITNSDFEGIGNAGDVKVDARNITFSNGGAIANFNSSNGNIGDTIVTATGDISFDGIAGNSFSGIVNFFTEEASGNIGEINLTAQNLSITNGATISSQVAENNDSGNINLNIADTILIDGFGVSTRLDGTQTEFPSSLRSEVDSNANAGNININTQNLFLSRNGGIRATVNDGGNSGNININAELITIGEQGNTNLTASSIVAAAGDLSVDNPDSVVNGGDINIDTGSLSISDGGNINARLISRGNGGNITINARDEVSITGRIFLDEQGETEVLSSIFVDIDSTGIGEAGNIEINTASLVVDQGFISADVLGEGNGGTINISATDSIKLSNVGLIQANIFEGATGNAGNLTIETKQLTLNEGSQISTSVSGDGNGGNITILADESINLSGVNEMSRGGIFANAIINSGNGGDINLTTDELAISDGAIITASNFSSRGEEISGSAPGTGEPGNISIMANNLNLETEGRIEAATQAETGSGAEINLQVADSIFLSGDSFISAAALGNANGGNLSIDTNFIVAFEGNNDIIASAEQGQGGNIEISAESLLGIKASTLNPFTNDINASSEFGLDGNVSLDVPDVSSLEGATELSVNMVDPGETTAQACNANRQTTAKNGLVIKGKGGVPPAPDLPMDSGNIIIGGEIDNSYSTGSVSVLPKPIVTSRGEIQPARGIKVTEQGKVTLTAYRTNNKGDRLPNIETSCR